MPRLRFKAVAALVLAATTGALVGGPARAQELRVGIQDDPDALDPATSGTYAGRFVFAAMCDKLVDISPELTIVPQLATAWTWDADQKGLTLQLRSGVTFQDGTEFDAAAVKFNIDRMLTMPDSRRKSELSAVAGAEVTGPDRVHLSLKAPFAPLLSVLSDRAGMMVSPTASAKENFAAHPVCVGPYAFAERRARDVIRLVKDPHYWDTDNYGYGAVTYAYVPDSTVRLARVRAGDLDLVERLAPTDLKTVRDDRNLQLASSPGLAVSHLFISLGGAKGTGPLAKDARVRQAFNLSLDRAVINRVAFSGEFVADDQMVPPSDPFHVDRPVSTRDLPAAKTLLAQAGLTTVPVEITFENALTDARVVQIVQSMAKEAGFDVKLVPLETATAIERYLAGNFEVYVGNWSGRADPDPTLYTFFSCKGGQNFNHYCNPALDQLLDTARAEADATRRKQLYVQADTILRADLPTLPLYHPKWFFAARKSVSGLEVYPDGLLRLRGVKPAP